MAYQDDGVEFEPRFRRPERINGLSDAMNAAFAVAALASRLAAERRTLVNHPDGRAENVAEHSYSLGLVAQALAEKIYPNLDRGLIAQLAEIHDAVEAYVGDTPTHNISETGKIDKKNREEQGLLALKHEFADMPGLLALIDMYEAQEVPEARFVKIVDKMMPNFVNFIEGGHTLRAETNRSEHIGRNLAKADEYQAEYPEFFELIDEYRSLIYVIDSQLYGSSHF